MARPKKRAARRLAITRNELAHLIMAERNDIAAY